METGDKVLLVLLAKVACCLGLALAAAGTLGGLGVWLLDGAGRWMLGAALIALIAATVFGRQRRAASDAPSQDREQGVPQRLEQQR